MKRILLVDDEATIRRILKLALEKAGFAVDTAENGEVALAKLRSELPDMLITDIEMPRMDGRALCSAVHKEFAAARCPIFVMTALPEREHREWSAAFDSIAFLEKPVSARRLIEAINARLDIQPAAPRGRT